MTTKRTTVLPSKLVDLGKAMTSNESLLPTETKKVQSYQRPTRQGNASTLPKRALTDISAFAELIYFHGGWSKFSECHDELAEFITKPQISKEAHDNFFVYGDDKNAYLRRLILMPRGHLKSSVGNILYCLWRVYRNPNIRILVASNLQSLAKSFIRELRGYFENPNLDKVWNNRPHIPGALLPQLQKKSRDRNFSIETEAEDRKVIWNNDALQVIRTDGVYYKEPTIYATSVGTTITGQHYDLVILDDLVDFKNTASEVKKAMVSEWIADVESVLNPPELINIVGATYEIKDIVGGEVVILGTRYALDDYYAHVIENQEELGYQVHSRNIYKNGTDASDGYLWDSKYNHNVLESIKARLSPRRFSSQYLNKVYEKDGKLFNTKAISVLPDNTLFFSENNCCAKHPSGRLEIVAPIIAVDPAFTTSKKGDDCAILVGFKYNDGTTVVLDAALDRMSASEVVSKITEFATKYKTLRVFYEQNGVGMLVPELFKTDASKVDGKQIVCFGHYEQREKESKIQGVLELPVNLGKIAVTERVRANEYLWKQINDYPGVRHDDFLDGLVTLVERSLPTRRLYTGTKNIITNYNYGFVNLPSQPGDKESYIAQYNSEYFE
jgi:phage terminase large subunit-like protein